jgi:hypothetical protein
MENPVIPGADASGSRTLDSTTNWKLSQFFERNGTKYSFYTHGCYNEGKKDGVSPVDLCVFHG